MSNEFVQFTFPCTDCLVRAACNQKGKPPIKIQRKTCLAIPEWDQNKKTYIKGLYECLINLSWDATKSLRQLKYDTNSNLANSIPSEYINFLIDILGTLQWIINSTSWREGELYNFDSIEIKNKLKHLSGWLNKGKD